MLQKKLKYNTSNSAQDTLVFVTSKKTLLIIIGIFICLLGGLYFKYKNLGDISIVHNEIAIRQDKLTKLATTINHNFNEKTREIFTLMQEVINMGEIIAANHHRLIEDVSNDITQVQTSINRISFQVNLDSIHYNENTQRLLIILQERLINRRLI